MPELKPSWLRLFTRRFWAFLLGSIIAFAVVVQIGRQAILLVNDYRDVLEASLSDQLGVRVQIGAIKASWHGLRLGVHMAKLDVFSESGAEIFSVGEANAELSLLDSAIQRGMAWRTITFEDFHTRFVQQPDHSWKIKGYDGGTANTDNPFVFDDPLDIFLFGRRVDIRTAKLGFEFHNGTSTELIIPKISLENDRFFHRMTAALNIDEKNTLDFVVEGYGDPRNRKKFSSSGYLEVKSATLAELTSAVLDNASMDSALPHVRDAQLGFQLWFTGAPDTGLTASGHITVDGLTPQQGEFGFDVPERIESAVSGMWNAKLGWQLALHKPELSWSDETLEMADIAIFGKKGQRGLRIPQLNIQDVLALLSSADDSAELGMKHVLSELELQGVLTNIEVQLTQPDQGYFLARANLSSGGSAAFKGSPALANINGYVETSLFSGYVDVDVDTRDRFSLALPKVFEDVIVLDSIKGQLAWRIEPENKMAYLESSRITATQGDKHLKAAFAMTLPFNREIGEESLSLMMNVDHAEILTYSSYLPLNVPKSLKSWLSKAVLGGRAENIVLLYNGSVSRDPTFEPSYQFAADFSQLHLQPDSAWPAITEAKGYFLLDSNDVSAHVASARSEGLAISSADIDTIEFDDGKGLTMDAELYGASNDAKQFLLSSPLKGSLGSFLPYWRLQGDYTASLALGIPFTFQEADIEYQVDVTVLDNRVYLQALDLDLRAVSGQFHYSDVLGFQSEGLDFELWGKAFSSRANSNNSHRDITLDFSGKLNTAAFSQWAKRPEFVFIQGNTDIQGKLRIPSSGSSSLAGLVLELESDLKGMAIDLPAPFYKAKKHSLPDTVNLSITSREEQLHYAYEHAGLFELDVWSEEAALPYVLLRFGTALDVDSTAHTQAGRVDIQGSLASANYEAWAKVIDRLLEADAKLSESGPNAETEDMQVRADLQIDTLSFFDVPMSDITIRAANQPDSSWVINAQSAMLKGRVIVPVDERPVDIDLDYLSIELDSPSPSPSELNPEAGVTELHESAFSDVDLDGIGNLKVNISQLMIDELHWGAWSFVTRDIEQGVLLNDFKATVRKLRIGHSAPSQFFWLKRGDVHSSRFIGSVEADDVGSALEAWDFDRLMSSKSASFAMDIAWDAEPDMIALPLLYGDVSLDIQNGSFLRGAEAGENPLLRLIALFNFDTLARRLRLDFSDLAAKGFAYDSVKADLRFDEGVALIQSPLVVESSSSKMQMVGAIDLVKEEIDAELVVTLPVAGNLAVATAFAAGLPAGLGVYIISKMFNKHVDKVSSISYSVEGSWEDPKMKVRRVFNNKTRKKETSVFSKDLQSRERLIGQSLE